MGNTQYCNTVCSRTFLRNFCPLLPFQAHLPYFPAQNFCSNHMELLAFTRMFPVLSYTEACMESFFYLNRRAPMPSSGELRLLLRTSNMTTPMTSSANSPGDVTRLSPFPQCFAHTSSTALAILHTSYRLMGLFPPIGSACLRGITSRASV